MRLNVPTNIKQPNGEAIMSITALGTHTMTASSYVDIVLNMVIVARVKCILSMIACGRWVPLMLVGIPCDR